MLKSQTGKLLLSFIIILSTAVIINLPTTTPYSLLNTSDNGYSLLMKNSDKILIYNNELKSIDGGVVILPLRESISSNTSISLLKLLKRNITLIILDDGGYAEFFFEKIGIKVVFYKYYVIDNIYHYDKNRFDPILSYAGGKIVGSYVHPIMVYSSRRILSLIKSSDYAYADENNDHTYTLGEPMGNITVGFIARINNSKIVYLSSVKILANKLFNRNIGLIKRFPSKIYLYIGNLKLSPIELWRIDLYRRINSLDKNLLSIALHLLSLPVLFYITGRTTERSVPLWYLYVYILASMFSFTAPIINPGAVLAPVLLGLTTILLLITMFSSGKYIGPYPILGLSLGLSVFPGLIALSTLLLIISLPLFVDQSSSRTIYLGNTSTVFVKTLLSLSVFVPIIPIYIIPIVTGFVFIIAAATYHYMKMKNITVKPIHIPNKLIVNKKESFIFSVEKPYNNYVLDYYINNSLIKDIHEDLKGYTIVYYSINRVGKHNLSLEVYSRDKWGLSSRKLFRSKSTVTALPRTPEIIRDIRASARRKGLLKSIIETLRGEAVIIRGRGEKIAEEIPLTRETAEKLLGELLNVPGYSASFFKPLLESLMGKLPMRRPKWYGEYRGVRYYIPGDPIRLIHWKKTVSRNTLFVKEYEISISGRAEAGRGNRSGETPLLIIALLDSSNKNEFEEKLNKLMKILYQTASRDPEFKLALSIISGTTILVLHARADELLTILLDALDKEYMTFLYEYDPVEPLPAREYATGFTLSKVKSLALNTILSIHSKIASYVNQSLENLGLSSPIYYTLIDSRSVQKRSLILRNFLKIIGYKYVPINEIGERLSR